MVIFFLKAQLLMLQWFMFAKQNHYKGMLGFFNSYLGHSWLNLSNKYLLAVLYFVFNL